MTQGRIEGVVLDTHGQPVADCTVMLTGASPDHQDLAALTADDGTFNFIDLGPGRYEVLARSEGGSSKVGVVDVDPPETSRLEIRLPKP